MIEVYHLIIYCLNCIRHDQNSTYKTGLRNQSVWEICLAKRKFYEDKIRPTYRENPRTCMMYGIVEKRRNTISLLDPYTKLPMHGR